MDVLRVEPIQFDAQRTSVNYNSDPAASSCCPLQVFSISVRVCLHLYSSDVPSERRDRGEVLRIHGETAAR